MTHSLRHDPLPSSDPGPIAPPLGISLLGDPVHVHTHGLFWTVARDALALLAAAQLAPLRRRWHDMNAHMVEVTARDIALPEWPRDVPPLTLLHISDMHLNDETSTQHWLRRISVLRYDALVVTGDLIHNNAGTAQAVHLLAHAAERARLGCYVVLGNHDYLHYRFVRRPDGHFEERVVANDVPRLQSLLEQKGIQVLHNRAMVLAHKRADGSAWPVAIVGLDDPYTGRAALERAMATAPHRLPLIVLAHTPDVLPQVSRVGASLFLAGHTHGGQVQLPLIGALTTSAASSLRYVNGYARYGKTQAYVSRGLGTGTVPLRLWCRPEIGLLRLGPPGNSLA